MQSFFMISNYKSRYKKAGCYNNELKLFRLCRRKATSHKLLSFSLCVENPCSLEITFIQGGFEKFPLTDLTQIINETSTENPEACSVWHTATYPFILARNSSLLLVPLILLSSSFIASSTFISVR